MSMLDVAKYLYFSKSIDLSHEEERYFNLSMANSGHLFSCLHSDRGRRDEPASCRHEEAGRERMVLFGKGK
jgi:hypothetical protein